MSRQKDSEIRKAIREMMQNNVMDLVIEGRGTSRERYNQNHRLFLYLEIQNTKPRLCYLYDLSEPVAVGRDERGSQICIQDMEVSRQQGRFWASHGKVYYANEPDAGSAVKIRRGFWSVRPGRGERFRLQTRDLLWVGTAKLKIRLFRGEQEMFE